jgi:uncharacterized membrane protein YfcA
MNISNLGVGWAFIGAGVSALFFGPLDWGTLLFVGLGFLIGEAASAWLRRRRVNRLPAPSAASTEQD